MKNKNEPPHTCLYGVSYFFSGVKSAEAEDISTYSSLGTYSRSSAKAGKIHLIILTLLLFAGCFCFAGNGSASCQDLVISEIMYNAEGSDDGNEWVEIYNDSDEDYDLEKDGEKVKDFKIKVGDNKHNIYFFSDAEKIKSQKYALITNNKDLEDFRDDYDVDDDVVVLRASFSLSNSSTDISLSCDDGDDWFGKLEYKSDWGADGNGKTLEKIDLDEDDEEDNWQESYVKGGTPGEKNSEDPGPIEYAKEIRINELLPDPEETPEKDHEYVELFNYFEEVIELDGWILADKSGEFALSGSVDPDDYIVFYDTVSLNNSGDEITLKNPNEEIVSQVAYEDSDEGRSYSYDSDKKKWKWTSLLTPGKENEFDPVIIYPDTLRINELLPDPEETPEKDHEFVELFNQGDEPIDLTSWQLRDETGKYNLSGAIGPKSYAVFYDTIYLNNDGDTIRLYDPNGKRKDIVTYRESQEGYSFSWDGKSWQWNFFKTPGKKNEFYRGEKNTKGIFVTEINPNPSGDESRKEYIEIFNKGKKKADLSGWVLKDATQSGRYIFPLGTEIGPGKRIIIRRSKFGFAMNNSGGEKVSLLNPLGGKMMEVFYDSAKESVSYNYHFLENRWRWSRFLTPGKPNKFNNLPEVKLDVDNDIYTNAWAEFKVKASDPDGDEIKVTWYFGDDHRSYLKETRHRYEKKGDYQAAVKVFDGSEEVIIEFDIEVKDYPHYDVEIVELVPNPPGKDSDFETVTLRSNEDDNVNLKNWSIATGWDILYNHPIYEDLEIDPEEEKIIGRDLCKFVLNNQRTKLELRYPNGEVADEIQYDKGDEKAGEGEIYRKTENGWIWIRVENTSSNIPIEEEEKYWEDELAGFLGGQSRDNRGDLLRRKLLFYGLDMALSDLIASGEKKVLGASVIEDSSGTYRFTGSYSEDHYLVKFLKNLGREINYRINKILL